MPSYLNVSPKLLVDAADEIDELVEDLSEAGKMAANYLSSIAPAGADEISAAIAAVFADDYMQMQISMSHWYAFMNAAMSRNLRVASDAYEATEAAAKYQLDVFEDNVEDFFESPAAYLAEKYIDLSRILNPLRPLDPWDLLRPLPPLVGPPVLGDGARF